MKDLKLHPDALTFTFPPITNDDLLRIYMEPCVAAIGKKIEADLLDLYAGFVQP